MDNIFVCDKCNYKCVYESQWNKHLASSIHLTGHKKKRADYVEPSICSHCGYSSQNKSMFNLHILNHHSDKLTRQKEFPFYCPSCDFGSFTKSIFDTHLLTKKHNRS